MTADWEIRQGDALALLREMPSESVHCVITSPPLVIMGMVKATTPLPESVEHGNVLIRECQVSNLERLASPVTEVTFSCDLGSVGRPIKLQCAEREHGFGIDQFYPEPRQQGFKDRTSCLVRSLITEETAAFMGVRFLGVVPTSESFGEEPDGSFINHADLNTSVVTGANPSSKGMVWGTPFNADVTLTINNASDVSEISVSSHSIPLCVDTRLYTGMEVVTNG